MDVVIPAAAAVMAAGFIVNRVFRMRRYDRRVEERLARKDEMRRRGHFRGAQEMELDQQ